MAALLGPPLMQVRFAPFRKVLSEPMKPHGDAAQLAVATLLSSPSMQLTFSFLRKVICEPMQPHGDACSFVVVCSFRAHMGKMHEAQNRASIWLPCALVVPQHTSWRSLCGGERGF